MNYINQCRICDGPLLVADSHMPGTVTACINPACGSNVWQGMAKDNVEKQVQEAADMSKAMQRAAAGLSPEPPKLEREEPRAARTGTPANARQYGGDHYKGVGFEHWDLVHLTNMDYWQGCATKYITRARKHGGGFTVNIQKAMHYVDKREELEAAGRKNNATMPSTADFSDYIAANQLDDRERDAMTDIIEGRWGEARFLLQQMFGEAERRG